MDQFPKIIDRYIHAMYQSTKSSWNAMMPIKSNDGAVGLEIKDWSITPICKEYEEYPFEMKKTHDRITMTKTGYIDDMMYKLVVIGDNCTNFDQSFLVHVCKLEIRFGVEGKAEVEGDRVNEHQLPLANRFAWNGGFSGIKVSILRKKWLPAVYRMLATDVFRFPIVCGRMQQKDIVYILSQVPWFSRLPHELLIEIVGYLAGEWDRNVVDEEIDKELDSDEELRETSKNTGILGVDADGYYDHSYAAKFIDDSDGFAEKRRSKLELLLEDAIDRKIDE